VLSSIGIGTRSAAGVVKLPDKAGFAAMMWNIPQAESLSLCTAYRADGAHCDVMPPALVDQLATYSKSTQPQIKPVAQGSESDSDDLAPPRVVKSKQRVKVKVPLKKKKR
jgi:D-alanyl-D-alanine carboxypeptidase